MSGLVLKLGPRERILINGAVIENGDKRSRISIVTPDAKILRLKDAIHPKDAKTPVRRLCYATQLTLTGDVDFENAKADLLIKIDELGSIFRDRDSKELIVQATEAINDAQPYRCLKALKALISLEDRLFKISD